MLAEHTGQMLSGLGNSLGHPQRKPAISMHSYSGKFFSGKPSSGFPAPQARYLMLRCIPHYQFPLAALPVHGHLTRKVHPCITKAATAPVLLRVKLKVYFETHRKLLAGNSPRAKPSPILASHRGMENTESYSSVPST